VEVAEAQVAQAEVAQAAGEMADAACGGYAAAYIGRGIDAGMRPQLRAQHVRCFHAHHSPLAAAGI
jgi:hypothetical protein